MKEHVSEQYGYRRPDGKVAGWFLRKEDRDQAVRKYAEQVRRLDSRADVRVDMVTKRLTTTEQISTERRVTVR